MTKRELRVELTGEDFGDAASARRKLTASVAEWATQRAEEGRRLELMLFLQVPGAFNERADELVEAVIFETPGIRARLKGQIVSVSIRSDELPMPIRGGSFVVE